MARQKSVTVAGGSSAGNNGVRSLSMGGAASDRRRNSGQLNALLTGDRTGTGGVFSGSRRGFSAWPPASQDELAGYFGLGQFGRVDGQNVSLRDRDTRLPGWSVYDDKGYAAACDRMHPKPRPAATPIPLDARALLDLISKSERTDDLSALSNGLYSGYEVAYNYNIYGKQTKPLTEMTLDEIDAYQGAMLADPRNQRNSHTSSAVGRYQFMRGTLRELRARLHLRGDEVFDADMQDRLAMAQLDFRGLNRYRAGELDADSFQNNLANEWASVPKKKSGKSRYNQPVGSDDGQVQAVIHGLNRYPDLGLGRR